jgi:hypothetical protein
VSNSRLDRICKDEPNRDLGGTVGTHFASLVHGCRLFREYARLLHRRSDTLGEDAMMAATARVHGLTLATWNERDFAHFDVAVLNPFKPRVP